MKFKEFIEVYSPCVSFEADHRLFVHLDVRGDNYNRFGGLPVLIELNDSCKYTDQFKDLVKQIPENILNAQVTKIRPCEFNVGDNENIRLEMCINVWVKYDPTLFPEDEVKRIVLP